MSSLDLEGVSDSSLMEGIAQGELDAFVQLFERYAPNAMALAQKILRRPRLAEEAVQDAFLAVWHHPDRYLTDLGTVQSWLMSTVHHRAVVLVRREESHRTRAGEAATTAVTDRVAADPADMVVVQSVVADEQGAVHQALSDLPPAQRQIVELMYFGGLTQSQISERLSLPLGTVRSRNLLAMRRL